MGRLVEIFFENNKDRFSKSVDVLEKSGITFLHRYQKKGQV